MKLRQLGQTVLIALLAGAVGGGVLLYLREASVAHRFLLVDQSGKPRASLTLVDGAPSLVFLGKNGRSRVVLGLDDEELPLLGFCGKAGETRMALSLDQGGSPVLGFVDEGKNLRLRLNLPEGLTLWDEHGEVRASVLFPDERRPEYSFTLFDEQGHVVWTAPRLTQSQPAASSKEADAAESQPAADPGAAPGMAKIDS